MSLFQRLVVFFFVGISAPVLGFAADTASNPSDSVPRGVVTDPLAWLEQTLSCDQVIEQVTVRYEPLGDYQDFPPEKQQEYDRIIEIMCSERFKKCHFERCKLTSASGSSLKSGSGSERMLSPEEVELQQELQQALAGEEESRRYATLLGRYQELQQSMIIKKVAEEKKQGLAWETFQIEQEIQKPKAPPANRSGAAQRNQPQYRVYRAPGSPPAGR